MLQDAFLYPIRGNGWLMVLLGAAFSITVEFMSYMPFLWLLMGVFAGGFFSAYYLDTVATTMDGRNDVPDWPDFNDFAEDILKPFLRMFGIALLAFGPAYVVIALIWFADAGASWSLPAFFVATAVGSLYFPMAVLAAQARGGVLEALPHVVVPAILRSLPQYFVAVVALVVAHLALIFAEDIAAEIPYVGWFATFAVALYALMFEARFIGLIHRGWSDRFKWD